MLNYGKYRLLKDFMNLMIKTNQLQQINTPCWRISQTAKRSSLNLNESRDVTVPRKMSEMRPRPNQISKAVNLKASEVRESAKGQLHAAKSDTSDLQAQSDDPRSRIRVVAAAQS